jgi:hypothetical protein
MNSYSEISRVREIVYRVKGSVETESIPMVIVGSESCFSVCIREGVLMTDKSDLADEREMDEDMARMAAEKWNCPYFETSAVSSETAKLPRRGGRFTSECVVCL